VRCHTDPTEVVSLDNTLETATNAGCRYLDTITGRKLLDRQYLSDLRVNSAKLTQEPMRWDTGLRKVATQRTVDLALWDWLKSKLNSLVAIPLDCPPQDYRTRTRFDDGTRHIFTAVGDKRRHAKFSTEQCCHRQFVGLSLQLDLNIDPCWNIQLGQFIDGFRRRAKNVDETLVDTRFKLFTRLFIHMWRTVNRYHRPLCGKWYRAGHRCPGLLDRLHNPLGRFIDQVVIVRTELDANALMGCHDASNQRM
jgi:hypothetical protein